MFEKNVEGNVQTLVLAKEIEVDVKKKGNINIAVFGNEKTGKYESFIYPNLNKMLGSYIVTDNDNKIYEKTNNLFRTNGYNIVNIDLKGKCNYNPFKYIKNETDALTFCNVIVRRNKEVKQEVFKEDMCEIIFRVIIKYILRTQSEEKQNLSYLLKLIDELKENDVKYFQDLILRLKENDDLMNYYNIIGKSTNEIYYSLLDLLKEKLNVIGTENIENISGMSSVDFNEIVNNKTILYVNVSDNKVLNGGFFTQLVESLHNLADDNKGYLNIPTYCILDNFERLGYISMFMNKIATSRSRRIEYSIIIDNIEDLLSIYEKDIEKIVKNCDLALYLGTENIETTKFVSENLEGYVTVDTLRGLHSGICMCYEKGISPIKAIKYGVETPSESELEVHKQEIFEKKEEEKRLSNEEAEKRNANLMKELEEKYNSATTPEEKEKYRKTIEIMNGVNQIHNNIKNM